MASFLYESIYVITAFLCAAPLLAPLMGIEKVPFWIMLILLAVSMLLTAFKRAGWLVRLAISGAAITVCIFFFFLCRNETIYDRLSEYSGYLILLTVSLGAFFLGEGLARFRVLRIITALALTAVLIVFVISGEDVDRLFVVAVLTLDLFTAVSVVQLTWPKEGGTDEKEHLVNIAPFLIISMLLVYISPSSEDPYGWTLVKKLYHTVYDKIQEMSFMFTAGESYDPSTTVIGFSGRGDISGNIEQKDEEVMTVTGISQWEKTVKLAGRTFNEFDGRKWTDTDNLNLPARDIDVLSLVASLYDYTDNIPDYIRKSGMEIKYVRLNSEYMFVPLKVMPSDISAYLSGVYSRGGDLIIPGSRPYKTEYPVSYYRINTDNEVFMDYLKSAGMASRENFDRACQLMKEEGMATVSYEDYIDLTEHIKQSYTDSVVLSEEVQDSMDKVYEGIPDIPGRMDALEAYLKGFDYSESPGELPADITDAEGFLDYFLTESKAGYCSHFATAFVLLARAQGVPARYVQGYSIDPDGDSEVRVSSSMAHAWPEVYYEGAGWIAYEPTPGYSNPSYWRTTEEWRVVTEKAGEYYADKADEEEAPGENDEDGEDKKGISIPWFYIMIPPLSGIIFIIIIYMLRRLFLLYRFNRMDERSRFVTVCRQNLYILELLGYNADDSMTLNEYASCIRKDIPDEDIGFMEDLSVYLYSGAFKGPVAVDDAIKNRKSLFDRLKKEHPVRCLRYLIRW